MDNHGILESLLFTAGDEGLDEKQLLEILDMSKDQLVELIENYSSHGLMIQRFGTTYVLTTKKEAATYIEQLIEQKSQMKLSQAAMEVLSIIAYNQPLSRSDIELIRSINSDGAVKTLIAKGLVEAKVVNEQRSQQLITTDLFLNVFGISNIEDLPTTEEDDEEMDAFFSNLVNQKEKIMTKELERLQKRIANSGYTSRRKAETLISEGKVKVNGTTVTELGTKVKPSDTIEVEGIKIELEDKIYILFHKPTQVITSVSDDRGRTVVTDYFKDIEARIYPVGRLDYDTSGLLLLTNDGEFTNLMTHPRYQIKKKYVAKLKGYLMREEVKALEKGIELEDGMTQPAEVKVKKQDKDKNTTLVEITITEGRNRQVRRMFEHFGHQVTKLSRIEYGPLNVVGLNAGEGRVLTPHEVKVMRHLAEHGK